MSGVIAEREIIMHTFKVLLFGANGQVGNECQRQFEQQGWLVMACNRQQADFEDPKAVYATVMSAQADVVVNACAYTAVDRAESESESQLAHVVNGDSVGAIAKACSELDIPVVHISTDYVFDGTAATPYEENAAVNPTGVYGASKLRGEQQLSTHCSKYILLRTSWVFSSYGANFVKTMLRLAGERDALSVVGDQRGCPTFAGDIASAIVELLNQYLQQLSPWGVFHCSSRGSCSWYEFAEEIFGLAVKKGLLLREPQVSAISTQEYPTAAVRPAYSVLNCTKLECQLGRSMPPWQLGLESVLDELR